jgi:Lrp/AsnC family transcriptional regulator, leucine-responsive regulatory protein
VTIDLKDRKILYELDIDARQSLTQIGKKVGLNKDVVSYRIKRMEDEGIIENYWTQIDSYKLGYNVFRYYLILQNATPNIKNEIINHLVGYKKTWVVGTCKGMYDLVAVIWVKSVPEFYKFWDETNDKYGDYFAEKVFSVYLQAYCYPLSYLLLDSYEKSSRDGHELITGGGNTAEIDEVDYRLLNEIAENGRMSLIDLAQKLSCSSQMVDYRIKNLRKKDVIQAFRVNIDISKIGYDHFKVDIYLKEPSQRKKIFDYLKYNKYVTFINTSAGYADIEVELNIENSNKMTELMDEVYTKFPGVIKKYTYFSAQKNYKLRCLPELTNADFKS